MTERRNYPRSFSSVEFQMRSVTKQAEWHTPSYRIGAARRMKQLAKDTYIQPLPLLSCHCKRPCHTIMAHWNRSTKVNSNSCYCATLFVFVQRVDRKLPIFIATATLLSSLALVAGLGVAYMASYSHRSSTRMRGRGEERESKRKTFYTAAIADNTSARDQRTLIKM